MLAVVSLASAMAAFSDSVLPVGAPMFEIDGRDCLLLRPLKLEEAALDARINLRRADQSAIARGGKNRP
jgi:hypothetical protein